MGFPRIFNVNLRLIWAKCYLRNGWLHCIQTWCANLLPTTDWSSAIIIFHGPNSLCDHEKNNQFTISQCNWIEALGLDISSIRTENFMNHNTNHSLSGTSPLTNGDNILDKFGGTILLVYSWEDWFISPHRYAKALFTMNVCLQQFKLDDVFRIGRRIIEYNVYSWSGNIIHHAVVLCLLIFVWSGSQSLLSFNYLSSYNHSALYDELF